VSEKTIYEVLRSEGVSRRDFLKLCGMLAGAMGLVSTPKMEGAPDSADIYQTHRLAGRVAHALETKTRLPIIWLEFQDCAGCTEALTRSHNPTLVDLVLNKISIQYHETLFAAAGNQAERAKGSALKEYAGQYVLVVEGAIPSENNGYCTISGQSALDSLKAAAPGAAAIIADGNCAAFGGLPKAAPNPTNARGVWEIIKDKTVINIPGCPAIPEVFTGVLAQFLVFDDVPGLDDLNRPLTFYGNTIHDRCLRRPFYESGDFVQSFDDEGARKGWCLYKLGCKGPTTYNACATLKWDSGLSFPVQSGHPCLGCSQPNFWDGGGFYQGQSAPLDRPSFTAMGAVAGVGAVVGAGVAVTNRAQKHKVSKEQSGSEVSQPTQSTAAPQKGVNPEEDGGKS
jgi:hydrogenase small subunit